MASKRLKGKARKFAKETGDNTTCQSKTYTLRLSDYFDCAQTVVKSCKGKIRMPTIYRNAAREVLLLREQVSSRFASTSTQRIQRFNASHQYFNSWLKDILCILGQARSVTTPPDITEEPDKRLKTDSRHCR